ncbi:DUF3977 family protein [Bacillus cytotoxicus]|uniref:DUF3977 domain-containing protein n=1 Tax=Bacillus cytotoxicus TaxID=580165 RepID=A0AAX2CBD0_9BACI|nr:MULTISPECIES: DUF3977 family protein [Bacillus cereus group]AWC31197.1 DUF3977 domain-containing protein [Bacillus cytotoxicus]AWC35239.1 DUF3977 domain-containing protein [Bacillus cytotoxicus]AWC59463.1 DUF3977 domain-containing protein [Bacillus cytotoxicus]KMT51983.1 hypothetical protein TU51_00815 [Bacillus cytotoxicus]MDH2882525.1 DUF3977 family protein [Bacillus cytotoxicus]
MKFIEIGIGNKWFLRTETELSDGSEIEEKGISYPIKFQSVYIRIWIRKTVLIIDSKEGIKKTKKSRSDFKIIFGIVSL